MPPTVFIPFRGVHENPNGSIAFSNLATVPFAPDGRVHVLPPRNSTGTHVALNARFRGSGLAAIQMLSNSYVDTQCGIEGGGIVRLLCGSKCGPVEILLHPEKQDISHT